MVRLDVPTFTKFIQLHPSKFMYPFLFKNQPKISQIYPSPLSTPGLAQTLVIACGCSKAQIVWIEPQQQLIPFDYTSWFLRDSHQQAIKIPTTKATITPLTQTSYVFHWAQLDILMRMGMSTQVRDHTSNGFLPKWAISMTWKFWWSVILRQTHTLPDFLK